VSSVRGLTCARTYLQAQRANLTRLGKLGLNSPTRAFAQRRVVAPFLQRLGGQVQGGSALSSAAGGAWCGEIILERFGVARLELVDTDPDMVERASRRLEGRAGVRVSVGDARRIEASDGSFDAVFDFGAIHQIPDWPAAIAELRRVLRRAGASSSRRWQVRSCGGRCGSPSRPGRLLEAGRSRARPSSKSLRRTACPSARALANRGLVYSATLLSAGLVGDLVGAAATDR
jgi:SAM-dependent methyltransferase